MKIFCAVFFAILAAALVLFIAAEVMNARSEQQALDRRVRELTGRP